MNKITVEACPETGICSIVRQNGLKMDLMPGEAAEAREAAQSPDALRGTLADINESFVASLTDEELAELAAKLR